MAKIIANGSWAEEGKIGITAETQEGYGSDVNYIELPEVGTVVAEGDKVCEIETLKDVQEFIAPIAGKIVAVNEELVDNPGLLNEAPESTWICEIEA